MRDCLPIMTIFKFVTAYKLLGCKRALTAGLTYRLDCTVVLNPAKTVTASCNVYCPY